jgi:hypothetical protein
MLLKDQILKSIKLLLPSLKINLHPDKTDILPLRNGVTFLGYRIFYNCRLLRKRNIKHFLRKLENNLILFKEGDITREQLESRINGWMGYAKFGNTYKFRESIENKLSISF